jgi:hypothetical protein
VEIRGNSACASCADTSSSGRPARCAQAACRRISSSRSGDDASRSDPDEATLSAELLDVLVTAYFGRPRPEHVARARLLALMSQYGWTLWASIMAGSSPLDFDFWEWGMQKYERALATFDGPELERLLDAAGGAGRT